MLYKILASIAILTGLIAPRIVAPAAQADGQTIVINELMWMGSSVSSADEWIELRNVSDQTVDVSGWSLTKKSNGAEVTMLTIPVGKVIPPGGNFVISNFVNVSATSMLNIIPDVVTTDVALSNSALQIKLYDAIKKLVDVADDGVGNPLAGSLDSAKKVYASMERNPVSGDGAQAGSWHTASRALGYKIGAVELGTPSSVNSNGLPIAHAGPDQSGEVGQTINFDGSDSVDPEDQTLLYAWDFGDSTTSSEPTPTHSYAAAGAYTVALTVHDSIDSSSDILKVTILNAPAAAPTLLVPAIVPFTSAPTTTTPETVSSCSGLHLSELYPNPPGIDAVEFIELVNDGDEEVTTGTCAIFTSATRTYNIPAGTIVARGAYLLLPKSQTHLTLNNGGSTVRFIDSDGTELDRVVYEAAQEGKSWALIDGTWLWTSKPTPNEKNILLVPIVSPKTRMTEKTTIKKTSQEKTSSKTVKVEPPPQQVNLKDVQELDSSDRVMIEGVVIAPRDVLGSTTSFIQTEDGGVSISIPNGEPVIQVGQTIQVIGTVRLKNGRRYVAVAAKSLKVLTNGPPASPTPVPTDDVGPDQADQLVHVKGVVALASGNRIEIDDGSGPVPIYIKSSTGIIRPKVKAGDTVEASGIVSVSTSGIRILPRTQDDLRVERVLGASTVAPTQTIVAPAASKSQTLWYWSLVALGGLVASAKPLWRKLREKKKAHG